MGLRFMPRKDKEARKEYDKAYRDANREKVREWKERDYLKHEESRKAQNREYYMANRAREIERDKLRHSANKNAANARRRAYYETHKAEAIARSRFKRTGFTPELVAALVEKQRGCCGICGEAMVGSRQHADHCHETKSPRGLLCADCNLGLGRFKDNEGSLLNAVEYLRNPPAKQFTSTEGL